MKLYSFEDFVNESMITVKRKYTDKHPAVSVYGNLTKRNSVMKAIVNNNGILTEEELNSIFGNKHNSNRWFKYNSRFVEITEDKDGNKIYKLTKHGQKIYDIINVKTNDISEDEKTIEEGISVNYINHGQKNVNVYIGNFQPFTSEHIQILESLHKQNNLPVVVLILNNEEFDKTKNPFDNDTQIMLFENLKNEFSFLEACFSINSSTLDSIFNILRPAYEPVLIGYCKDNKYLIETQINDKETRIALNVFDNFNGFEAAIKNEDESAEKVRKSLYLDNEILYKAQVPESLYIQYEILKNIMNEAK